MPQKWKDANTALARWLKERGIKQTAIAEAVGVSKKTINAYVLGRRKPSLRNARMIAQFVGADDVTLFPTE